MAEILVSFDPRTLSPDQYRSKFIEFLEEYCLDQLEALLLLACPHDQHHSFIVHCQDLVHFDSALSYSVLHYPHLLLPILKEAVMELQFGLQQHPAFEAKWKKRATVKANVHVRMVSIPSLCDLSKATIGDVRSHEVNSLIQITGTVVRTGGVRMLELSKQYECMNPKCRYRFTVTADPEQDHMLPQPRTCPSKIDSTSAQANRAAQGSAAGGAGGGGRGGGGASKSNKCNSVNLREIEGSRVCVDYQEIKVQDHIERLGLGSVPRSIVVILQADLVDKFNPGDDVVIVGTIVRRWRPVVRGVRCTVDVAIEANSVLAVNAAEQVVSLSDATAAEFDLFWRTYRQESLEFQARNVIVRSVCPQLYGLFQVKLALLLALIGGSNGTGGGGGGTSAATVDLTEGIDSGSEAAEEGLRGRDGAVASEGQNGGRGVRRRTHIHMLMVSYRLVYWRLQFADVHFYAL
jgi:DNA helicase MCM9